MPGLRRTRARFLIPRAAVRSQPLQHLQLPFRRRFLVKNGCFYFVNFAGKTFLQAALRIHMETTLSMQVL
jgi:hypothetical protein